MEQRFLFLKKDWNKLTLEFEKIEAQVGLLLKEGMTAPDLRDDGSNDIVEEPPELGVAMSRLDSISKILRNSEVISDTSSTTVFVRIGSSVTIRVDGQDEETWMVGSYRVLDKSDENEISYTAPRISPLLGLQVGDSADIITPRRGAIEVEITAIT